MSTESLLALVLVTLLVFSLAHVFSEPLRLLLQLLLHAGLGLALLMAANGIAALFGAGIAYNPYTVLMAGFLNLPGVALLFVLRYWLGV